ncbi:MAG: undecaprenyl-phosphate 4-deoxy-4-formamido-L-arabinose transferase [Nitrospinaceae bacterium]|nr:MAG: undecaprenyl-phosphate 4-deoxy-4-formamido-L-arabinose transferase [Nitrospinaceae bacterium]
MDKSEPVEISLVIPVYNEAPILPELVSRLTAVCSGLGKSYEIILVDDGSCDASFQVLQELKKRDDALRVLKFTRNFGQQAAVLAGFRLCRGDIVVQLDSDLQHPPEEIPKLLDAFTDEVDLVTTIPLRRRDGLLRVLGSKYLHGFGKLLFGGAFKLNLSSFRAMRRPVIEKVEACRDQSRYMAVLMSWMGVPSVEIQVEHHIRQKGRTKYSILNLIQLTWDLITGYSSFPLRMVTYMGLLGAMLGFAVMMFLLYQRVVEGILIEGFIVLSAVFAFFASVQLLSIGFLGEYLGRVHMQIQNRPEYIVEKVVE